MRSPDQIGITWEENQLLMQQLREKAALEHRLQHNIFEVGDKVVSTLDGDEDWKNAVCEILAFHKKMAITTGFSCAIHHYDYRHATDEEIKAGKRLEVK
ncbi:hypothetical protein [Acinetobacter sp. YH12251]|uniref:hypothetical protein n=1 Tax=Acinetobacter sp. YH12251 TaxID=2601176 RepID=UPI0015D0DB4E|nr:hypothetical protein [Acinetobacter sp. YH12251]